MEKNTKITAKEEEKLETAVDAMVNAMVDKLVQRSKEVFKGNK